MVARWSRAGALSLVLVGCGSGEHTQSVGTPGQPPSSAGQRADEAPPAISIAGRWGMFHFEDPVAVDIAQDGAKLTGLGCDAGLPMPSTPDVNDRLCTALTGAISGDSAWFEFRVPDFNITYRAEVTASKDATRMTGSFTDAAGRLFQSSWLRLRDDQKYLPRRDGLSDPLSGDYALTLIAAQSSGSSFDASMTYEITYAPGLGIYGELGAFYYTELTRTDVSAPIQIGPVAATGQVLPVRIQLDHDAVSVTRVTAVDAAGTVSVFSAVRTSR